MSGFELKVPVEELRKRSLFVATPMYGGQCTGIFTRSVSDLTALCAHYGVKLRMFYLFNESLITRGRSYAADEFMRSGDSHFMFIDADIGFNAQDIITMLAMMSDESDYDVLCGPYAKKCLHSSTKILTENGLKTVNWVVSNQYKGKVKTFNRETGFFEWNNVISHSKEKNVNKSWVGLVTKLNGKEKIKHKNSVVVTTDHEVPVVSNPRDNNITWVRADETLNKWIITDVNQDHPNHAERNFPVLNDQQYSALLGITLGDGHINKNGIFVTSHTKNQYGYSEYIGDIFSVETKMAPNGALGVSFINPDTKYLRDIMYPNGKKEIKSVIPLIDDIALAHIFMDDGNRFYRYKYHMDEGTSDKLWWYNTETGLNKRCSYQPEGDNWIRGRDNKDESTSSIALMSFTWEENQLFVDHLKEKFGIDASIVTQKTYYKGKHLEHPLIKIDRDNSKILYSVISKWIPECMEYKLDPEFRGGVKGYISSNRKGYSLKEIKKLDFEVNRQDSHLYDIGVENNHNMVVNSGVVVHNCISWEKIKQAVDKGVADENPNELEKFVGDYVFNPVSGAQTMALNMPSEVLEAGTGFMMIKRKVFEEFQKAYPEQMYRPDHIRTENFDGSREICAFFDTPIDHKHTHINKELEIFLDKNPKATHKEILEWVKDPNAASRTYSKRYLSEDYMFCQWVRNIGMKVWMCPWMKLQHMGSMVYGGSLEDLAKIGAVATASPDQIKKRKNK